MGPEIDVLIRGVSYKRDSYIRAFVSHNKEHLRRDQIFCFLIRGIHCKRASYKRVPLYLLEEGGGGGGLVGGEGG